jgi:hypothetical protein
MANNDWTQQEVQLIVSDYFSMLQLELEQKKYSKKEHRSAIIDSLDNRSDGSVEFKHQNISAVLANMGLPYIKGYKPRFNYQKQLLEQEVAKYLVENRSVFERDFERFSDENVKPLVDYTVYFQYLLDNELPTGSSIPNDEPSFRPMKVNYLEREQNNRQLGEGGENLVIEYEKWRLKIEGRPDLSQQIHWVSKDQGDGAGFDILSKNVNGSDRFIEVKTTKLSKETPIYLTKTELLFATLNADNFFLYRVFNFDSKPQFFIKAGSYESYCKLQPLTYKAYF